MTRALSVHLDLLRLVAATVVFLSHAGTQRISGGLGHQFGLFGETAVDVFFVLSGFVIGHVVASRETGPRAYAVNRAARILSVVVPALLLGLVFDSLGPGLDPDLYAQAPNFAGPAGPAQLGSSLLFLDHLWSRAAQPGSNLPYWSLCFEVAYYAAFGCLAFAPRPWNAIAAAAVLLLAGPKIALLFPLWLLGVGCQRLCAGVRVPEAAGWWLATAPLVLFALWPHPFARSCYPYEPFDDVAGCISAMRQDYWIGLLVAAHLVGMHALADRLAPLMARIAAPVQWLAGASFTLYLLHFPLLHAIVAASPWPATDWATRAMVFLGAPLVVLAVAEVSERRKRAWRTAIAAVAGERGR